MFSSLFGKRRSSPVEDDAGTPPIPGAAPPRPDEEFVMVDPNSPRNNLYPNVGGQNNLYPNVVGPSLPYSLPQRPAPPAPVPRKSLFDPTFHYLQGVPFEMSRTLQMASSKDSFATETADLLAFLTNKINVSSYEYDFSVERSVLKEY